MKENNLKLDKETSLLLNAYSKKLIKKGDEAAHNGTINQFCKELAYKTHVNLVFLIGHIDDSRRDTYRQGWHDIINEAFEIVIKEKEKNENTTVS